MSPATRINAATATHQGRVRRRNEDHHALSTVDVSRTDGEVTSTTAQAGPFLAVVADGLGGHPAGDVASRVAVETIAARFPVDGDELCEAVHRSNDRVVQAMREPGGRPAMGTTISAVVVHGNRFTVVNVGDSPVFELVDDDLEQLSVDDSDHSGYLTQTIGGSLGIVPVAPHVADHVVDARRRIMLSSDGLTNFVTAPQIVDALTETDPARAVERLISLTLEAGAPDNVTVVVLDLEPLTSAQLPSSKLKYTRKTCDLCDKPEVIWDLEAGGAGAAPTTLLILRPQGSQCPILGSPTTLRKRLTRRVSDLLASTEGPERESTCQEGGRR